MGRRLSDAGHKKEAKNDFHNQNAKWRKGSTYPRGVVPRRLSITYSTKDRNEGLRPKKGVSAPRFTNEKQKEGGG